MYTRRIATLTMQSNNALAVVAGTLQVFRVWRMLLAIV